MNPAEEATAKMIADQSGRALVAASEALGRPLSVNEMRIIVSAVARWATTPDAPSVRLQ